jgi:Rrf2 family protein
VRLTSKTAYGVQALYDMAFHGGGRPVQAREVSERQRIPLRYLEQILQELRRAGLVEGKRGPGGGYALARKPEEVRLGEVVTALDGPIDFFRVPWEGPRTPPRRAAASKARLRPRDRLLSCDEPAERSRRRSRRTDGTEVVSGVWRELAEQLSGLLAAITLQDLVTRAEALGVARATAGSQMYFI